MFRDLVFLLLTFGVVPNRPHLERIEAFSEEGNEYAEIAREHYDPDVDGYRDEVIDALEDFD